MEPAPQPSNGISGEKKSWMGRKPRVRSCLCCFHEPLVSEIEHTKDSMLEH